MPLLRETVEDLNAAYVRSADAQDCIEHNTANVTFLEDQLQTLQRKLLAKQTEKDALDREIDQLKRTVELGIVLTPGLCIRQLEKRLLTRVLSYLNPTGGVNRVCRYWAQLAADVRLLQLNAPEKALSPPKVLKRSKSEVKTALAHIRSDIMLRELTRSQAAKLAAAEGGALTAGQPIQQGSPSRAGSATHGTVTPAPSAPSVASVTAQSHTTAVSSVGESTAAVVGGAGTGGAAVNRKSQSPNGGAGGASPAVASPKIPGIGKANVGKAGDLEVSDTSDSDDSDRESGVRKVGPKAGATGGVQLHRTDSKKSNSGNVRVSFDNLLSSTHVHNQSFTTKVSPVQATSPGKKRGSGTTGGTAGAISQKHLAQPPQEDGTARDVANFVNNLQWGRERPSSSGVEAANVQGNGKRIGHGNNGNSSQAQARPKREDRTSSGVAAAEPTLPAVAESKKKSSRVKLTSKSAHLPPSAGGSTGASSKKIGPSGLPDNENSRNLLLHVKKVRSEQQMNAMLDYLQAGFIKIETLTTEKRRIKKLIKAWNASFEKNNARLPTSSERKGHLRELYEEYHQVYCSYALLFYHHIFVYRNKNCFMCCHYGVHAFLFCK